MCRQKNERATTPFRGTESHLALVRVVALTEDSVRQLELEWTTWTLLADYPGARFGDPLTGTTAGLRLNEMMKQAGLGKRLPTRLLKQSYQAALQTLRERHSKQG
jgi:hypothetical protein